MFPSRSEAGLRPAPATQSSMRIHVVASRAATTEAWWSISSRSGLHQHLRRRRRRFLSLARLHPPSHRAAGVGGQLQRPVRHQPLRRWRRLGLRVRYSGDLPSLHMSQARATPVAMPSARSSISAAGEHTRAAGFMYWNVAQFLFKGCAIMYSAIGLIARSLGVHPLGLPVVFVVLNVLINVPVKEKEFQDFHCACGQRGLFRMSYVAKWFCPSCLESYLWRFNCALGSRRPTYPPQGFKILVFGNPEKSLDLDRFPELHHIAVFPSWYPTKVTENWFNGELKIEYTSFSDILNRVEPRKCIAVYNSCPPHRVLRKWGDVL